MANTTETKILTSAGKALLADVNAKELAFKLDKFIFANIPDRADFPQPGDGVPTEYVVFEKAVETRGKLSADTVIYTTTLESKDGPFEFNWTGGFSTEHGVLVTIDHHALTPKTANEPGVVGNTLVRNITLEYKDIAEITNITVDAQSWQYNATPRMKKMDDDSAQAIIDQNGKDWFIDDGFLVTPSGSAFNIKAGAGYVSGNRVMLEFDRNVQVPNKPSFIYVDAHREGTPTGEQVTLFDFVVTAEEKDDYTDANDVKHFVCKIAQVLSDSSVSDLRPKEVSLKQESMLVGGIVHPPSAGEIAKVGDLVASGVQFVRLEGKIYKLNKKVVAGELTDINLASAEVIIGGVTYKLSRGFDVGLVSDFSFISALPGEKLTVSGFNNLFDFKRHPGFLVRAGVAPSDIPGRRYNLSNGTHAVLDADENSITANWIGAIKGRTDEQNRDAFYAYLTALEDTEIHTVFFNDDLNIGELIVSRENTYFVTNQRRHLSSSKVWVFQPHLSNFKLSGFRAKEFNSRLIYMDKNTEQVVNHDFEDIRIDGIDLVNRTPFLYSTAQGGKGWRNISFEKVRGFTDKTAVTPLINLDHSASVGICADVYLTACRAHGYTELVSTTGSGFCEGLEIKSSFAIDCNGRGIQTYHTRGGLVIQSTEVTRHAKHAYVWAGLVMSSTSRRPANITNNKFNECTDEAIHQITGKSIAHGVVYEQLQKAVVSGNSYQNNLGAGYVVGAASLSSLLDGETSVQNMVGAIICSDAGGLVERIRDVTLSRCNHWGNKRESVLIAGRVERVIIAGGNHKDNCTSNADWQQTPTDMSTITFDKDHSEVKEGLQREQNPQLNYLRVISAELGKSRIGLTDVNSYPEHSVFINSPDVQCNVFVTNDCALNAMSSEIKIISLAGTRIFVRNNTKLSAVDVELLEKNIIGGGSIDVIDGNFDWEGNQVGA